MRITVSYLGPAASFAGSTATVLEFEVPVTVKELMDAVAKLHGYRFDSTAWAVLIDGKGVPPPKWETWRIEEDCRVTVLPMLSGG